MPDTFDDEIAAIGACLNALGPLEPKGRQTVLQYVAKRLQISMPGLGEGSSDPPCGAPTPTEHIENAQPKDECHISELVEKKKPRSAVEMAVIVAYYLSHRAPKQERKQAISTEDLTTYFKIAEFKLPSSPQYTLPNTKNAGYLDSAGSGKYKLNPVGYNLVVHSMPKPAEAQTGTRRSNRNRATVSRHSKATARKRGNR